MFSSIRQQPVPVFTPVSIVLYFSSLSIFLVNLQTDSYLIIDHTFVFASDQLMITIACEKLN